MDTLEFEHRMLPRLRAILENWYWEDLEDIERYNLHVGFGKHMKKLANKVSVDAFKSMANQAPQTLSKEQAIHILKSWLIELFYLKMVMYQHLDRSAGLSLLIHCYEARFKHFLTDVSEIVHYASLTDNGKKLLMMSANDADKRRSLDERRVSIAPAQNGEVILDDHWSKAGDMAKLFRSFRFVEQDKPNERRY